MKDFHKMQIAELSIELTDETLKRCSRCEESLPRSEFGISRAQKDGLNFYCKRCVRKKTNESRSNARVLKAEMLERMRREHQRLGAETTTIRGARLRDQVARERSRQLFGPAETEKLPPLYTLPPIVRDFASKARRLFPYRERVLRSLKTLGPQTFDELKQSCRIEIDPLSDAINEIHGRRLPVISVNGTGPRTYSLNPAYQPPKSDEEKREISRQRAEEPAMSFANLRLPTTPIMKGNK